MYLLVFVTLVIGMIGIYAQVLSVQAARIASSQNSIAQAMNGWNYAAVSMAASIIDTQAVFAAPGSAGIPPTTGCSLSYAESSSETAAAVPLCPSPIKPIGTGTAINSPANGTITNGSNNLNLIYNIKTLTENGMTLQEVEPVHLPPGYDQVDYQFYSVLFRSPTGQNNFVVTFVPPAVISATNPAPGFLSLAGSNTTGVANQIGLTAGDLMQQLQHTGTPRFTYGVVQNPAPSTYFLSVGGFSWPLPSNGAIPVDSVAIIASPDGL